MATEVKIRLEVPGGGDRVLLHACCAPCSGAIVETLLRQGIRPTIFFSDSNIFPEEEYWKRLAECRRYAESCSVELVEDEYDHADWRDQVKGLELLPERGERCAICFRYRLLRSARYAHEHGFPVLATTLASSRWKSLEQVDAAGRQACSLYPDVTWWAQNWRKGGLQERRGEIIREQDFYNQIYCGCEFSINHCEGNFCEKILSKV